MTGGTCQANGSRRRSLEIVDHFFSPAVQFGTTAIGVGLVLRSV